MKQRVVYIDWLKALGIFGITYGHISTLDSNPLQLWLNMFKITIFFIVAGYMMGMTGGLEKLKEKSIGSFTKKRLFSLLVPYLVFGIAAIIIIGIADPRLSDGEFDMRKVMRMIMDLVTFKGYSTQWFLPVLFAGEVMLVLASRLPRNILTVLVFLSAPLALTFALSGFAGSIDPDRRLLMQGSYNLIAWAAKSFTAFWFLYVGLLLQPFLSKDKHKGAFAILGLAILIVTWNLSWMAKGLSFHGLRFGEIPAMFFVIGVADFIGLFWVTRWLSGYVRIRFLEYWGENSIVLMLTQRTFKFVTFAQEGWKKLYGISKETGPRFYFDTLMIFILVLLMSYSAGKVIDSVFPAAFGRKKHA